LLAQGDEVALLALFVGYTPAGRGLTGRVRRLGRRMSFHLHQARSLHGEAKRIYLARKGRDAARDLATSTRSLLWRLTYGLFDGSSGVPSWLLRNVEEMNLHAARSYVPGAYPGRMTVFLSGATLPGFSFDPERDLDGL